MSLSVLLLVLSPSPPPCPPSHKPRRRHRPTRVRRPPRRRRQRHDRRRAALSARLRGIERLPASAPSPARSARSAAIASPSRPTAFGRPHPQSARADLGSPGGADRGAQFEPVGRAEHRRHPHPGIGQAFTTAIELGGFVGIGKTGVITSEYDRLSISVSYRKGVTARTARASCSRRSTISPRSAKRRRSACSPRPIVPSAAMARPISTSMPRRASPAGCRSFRRAAGGRTIRSARSAPIALTGDLLHGFKLVGGGTYLRMLNDFGRSPVVSIAGARDQWQAVVGLAYTF